MKTTIIKLAGTIADRKKIKQAARVIRKGGLVAFPTETVYGLGANAVDAQAVKKIFKAKGRPSDNPLIVHVANKKDFSRLAAEVTPAAKKLISNFCPGPLTLVLKKSKMISSSVSAGLDTVAIRMPSHPVALKLIKESKVPIAAPSANLSGKPSPTDAKHVIEDLNGKIDVIIDAGKTKIGVESTVVDMTTNPPTLLRPGGITREALRRVVDKIAMRFGRGGQIAKSPGMKYRHYAPNAKLILIEGRPTQVIRKIKKRVCMYRLRGKRVGIMTIRRDHTYDADAVILVGTTPTAVARNIFHALREFDKRRVDIVLAEGIAERGMGLAVMNRLRKAATTLVRKA
ncbi:threonylcarbamoyl-AMP synthase [Candidatus Woesearchaeota archaeon]|nr:threonylcarbamoyl-AMP synthase [Candidatus Woesearchaeota archaeon]